MPRAASGMDMNGRIAAVLRDFAAIQKSRPSMWGYKRAARTIMTLEEPIESYLQPDGTLRKIPNIGPASSRVILEILQTGISATVERAIEESGQTADIERRRDLRGHFLSRAQVLAALKNRKLVGPTIDDYRGDLQMHSTWSDGSQSLEDIIEAGIARGYEYCAVTDQTARMVTAVKTKGVHILGHPRGRMYGSRPGVTADWEKVFKAAKRSGVAIEIDGDPARQDLDYDVARAAVAAGCTFALDSDAHSPGELRYAETSIAHARLAGVPPDRIINCWPLERLLEWCAGRRP